MDPEPITFFPNRKLLLVNGFNKQHQKQNEEAYSDFRKMSGYCQLLEAKLTDNPMKFKTVGRSFKANGRLSHSKQDFTNSLNELKQQQVDHAAIFLFCHSIINQPISNQFMLVFEGSGSNKQVLNLTQLLDHVSAIRAKHIDLIIISCYASVIKDIFDKYTEDRPYLKAQVDIYYSIFKDNILLLYQITKKNPNGCLPLFWQLLNLQISPSQRQNYQKLDLEKKISETLSGTNKYSEWRYLLDTKNPQKFYDFIYESYHSPQERQLRQERIRKKVKFLKKSNRISSFSPLNQDHHPIQSGSVWSEKILFIGRLNCQGKLYITTKHNSQMQIYSKFVDNRANGFMFVSYGQVQRKDYYLKCLLGYYEAVLQQKYSKQQSTNLKKYCLKPRSPKTLRLRTYRLVTTQQTVFEMSKVLENTSDRFFVKISKGNQVLLKYCGYFQKSWDDILVLNKVQFLEYSQYKTLYKYQAQICYEFIESKADGQRYQKLKVIEDNKNVPEYQSIQNKYPIQELFCQFLKSQQSQQKYTRQFRLKVYFAILDDEKQVLYVNFNESLMISSRINDPIDWHNITGQTSQSDQSDKQDQTF